MRINHISSAPVTQAKTQNTVERVGGKKEHRTVDHGPWTTPPSAAEHRPDQRSPMHAIIRRS